MMRIETVEQAYALLVEKVFTPSKHDFVVLPDKTLQRGFGWVFFYTTRDYLLTGNPSKLVPGVGPVIVTVEGDVAPLSTSVPPPAAIAEFERNWNNAHALGGSGN